MFCHGPISQIDNGLVPYPTIHHSEQISVLNGVLWDVMQVRCGMCEIGLWLTRVCNDNAVGIAVACLFADKGLKYILRFVEFCCGVVVVGFAHIVQGWCTGTKAIVTILKTINHTNAPYSNRSQIAKFMGPTWGPPGSCRPQMGPMLAPWTLLSGMVLL